MCSSMDIQVQANGQKEGSWGYGEIVVPELNVYYTYGNNVKLKTPLVSIGGVENFILSSLGPEKNNCSLGAITRVLDYRRNRGYSRIPGSYNVIYNDVLQNAKVSKSFKESGSLPFGIDTGTLFWRIDDVAKYTLNIYDYRTNKLINFKKYDFFVGNAYGASFERAKAQLDKAQPIIINISYGTYANHSVTGTGYMQFETISGETLNFLQVYDGWNTVPMYINYNQMIEENKIGPVKLYSITEIYPN